MLIWCQPPLFPLETLWCLFDFITDTRTYITRLPEPHDD